MRVSRPRAGNRRAAIAVNGIGRVRMSSVLLQFVVAVRVVEGDVRAGGAVRGLRFRTAR